MTFKDCECMNYMTRVVFRKICMNEILTEGKQDVTFFVYGVRLSLKYVLIYDFNCTCRELLHFKLFKTCSCRWFLYWEIYHIFNSLAATEMPYVETEITKESSPLALSLAGHLRSVGAKLYGAFWCTYCKDQKQVSPFCSPFIWVGHHSLCASCQPQLLKFY